MTRPPGRCVVSRRQAADEGTGGLSRLARTPSRCIGILIVAFALGGGAVGAISDMALDPSFAPPFGYSLYAFNLGFPTFRWDAVRAIAVQSDGKILIEAESKRWDGTTATSVARLRVDGGLDAGFGSGGIAYLQVNGFTVPGGLAVQPDGRIVVGGTTIESSDTAFFAARLTPAGLLDTTFNAPLGYLVFNFYSILNPGSYGEYLRDVALQGDGGIVLAGGLFRSNNRDFGVARLLSNGTPDWSFGGSLCACQAIAFNLGPGLQDDVLRAVATGPSDTIVVAGQAQWSGSDYDWAVARLTAAGALDTTFNGSGKETLPWDAAPERTDIAADLAVLADGRIVVAGTVLHDDQGSTVRRLALARFAATGGLDTTFGPFTSPGRCPYWDVPLVVTPELNSELVGLGIDARGRSVVGHDSLLGGYGATRFSDPDCQTRAATGGGQVFASAVTNGFGALGVGPDQRLVVSGTVLGATNAEREVAALRLWVSDLFRDDLETGTVERWSRVCSGVAC